LELELELVHVIPVAAGSRISNQILNASSTY